MIIYSGVTNYMSNSLKYLHTYVSCPSSRKIVIPDGSLNTIAGKGNIKISHNLILESVLHVPNFSH